MQPIVDSVKAIGGSLSQCTRSSSLDGLDSCLNISFQPLVIVPDDYVAEEIALVRSRWQAFVRNPGRRASSMLIWESM